MKKRKSNYKKYKFTYIKATVFTLFICTLFMKGYISFEETGENYFHIIVNGQEVGIMGEKDRASELLVKARRNVAAASNELVFMDANLEIEGEEVLWGYVNSEEDILENMETALRGSIRETMHHSYTMKVNEYIVNLASLDEVNQLLQAAVDKYDRERKFQVSLVHGTAKQFNVLTTSLIDSSLEKEEEISLLSESGVQSLIKAFSNLEDPNAEKDFEDYDLGILYMDFSEEVEVVEAYLPESQLTLLADAIEEVTKEQEVSSIYEVVSGDTLSGIAIKVDIPMDDIVAMNDSLESINSTLHIGQQLTITIPEPELSVTRVEQIYRDEYYDADVEYIDNNNWFTTTEVVRQQPSAGYRRIVADVYYINDKEVSREILKEEIVMPAVAKVVERGTKRPPKFIYPVNGVATSGFGPRKAPTKGASSNHKGQDWAVPTGTAVKASSGGTVTRAGWGSGYGYVVYIDHGSGVETRYAHLSKILVKVGQKVKQGERIALSGNTGVSTGPHLHFEIWMNNTAVNPMKYVEK